jgi:hypothetical protein
MTIESEILMHNRPLADRFPDEARPVAGGFANAWPPEVP